MTVSAALPETGATAAAIGGAPDRATDRAPDRVPGRSVGAAAGGMARWRILYTEMVQLKPGDLIRYEEMGDLLGLDFLEPHHKKTIAAAARRAADELCRTERMVFRPVRGHGYQLAQPDQVIELARAHQARAVAEVEAGHTKIETIDLNTVDVTTARLIEATAIGFARQAAFMHQLDVRQDRLEAAMDALAMATQIRTEAICHRVDATDARVDELHQQLADLQDRKRGSLPRNSPRPGAGT